MLAPVRELGHASRLPGAAATQKKKNEAAINKRTYDSEIQVLIQHDRS